MQRSQFYKSMTAHADHRVWQDVYHVPSVAGLLYVKFTPMPSPISFCCLLRRETMADPVCPETGASMYRAVRPMTLNFKGESVTFDMPGWYCDQSEQSVHTGDDMKVSDRILNRLKARDEG